jgi:putative insertion element HTH domain-containing protein
MDTQQNSTSLTPQQERFIDFVASGQLNLDLKRRSYEEFAKSLGVDRTTLYNWRKTIPGFWDKVASRSNSIVDRRLPKIMNALLAKALKGDVAAAKLLLNQAGRLKAPPTEEDAALDYSDRGISSLFERAIGIKPGSLGSESAEEF